MKTTTNRAAKKNTDLAIIIAFEETKLQSWTEAYRDLRADAEAAAERLAARG